MKSQVNYNVLGEFLEYDDLQLEFDRVTNNIRNIDIDYGIDIIFKYYRKYGFPHYTIREEEKHQHMKKLQKFDVNTILDGDRIIQTMHCLRLAWSYFPHFWNIQCGNAKMTPWDIFHDDDKFKSTIKKTWNDRDWETMHCLNNSITI